MSPATKIPRLLARRRGRGMRSTSSCSWKSPLDRRLRSRTATRPLQFTGMEERNTRKSELLRAGLSGQWVKRSSSVNSLGLDGRLLDGAWLAVGGCRRGFASLPNAGAKPRFLSLAPSPLDKSHPRVFLSLDERHMDLCIETLTVFDQAPGCGKMIGLKGHSWTWLARDAVPPM